MFISLAVYAMKDGWGFAFALVYLIFVHEMGHLVAARMKGIKTSPAIFIPFIGAVISMKEQPKNASTESFIAYGGPLAGLLSFLPALPLYWWTHDPIWALVIFLGAIINLFNLLPISPLDGGRIVSVLSTKVWFFGLLGLGIMLFFTPEPILFFIFVLGLFSWWGRIREGYQQRTLEYEKTRLQRLVDECRQWPTLDEYAIKRENLRAEAAYYAENRPPKKKFLLPFVQDDKRFAKDKWQLDHQYSAMTWELYQQWERTPVLYQDSNPDMPLPNPLLAQAAEEAAKRMKEINEQLHRLNTYYDSPARTKWKVLAAYLGLAAVLSVFTLYGNSLMQLYM